MIGHEDRRVAQRVRLLGELHEHVGPGERSTTGQGETEAHGRILLVARLPVKGARCYARVMMREQNRWDVIVIGAGHAGCEAALASARMGCATLMLTMNLDAIGQMSCNPAVGGTAKGHLVRELDALGGEMGRITDLATIQFRILNASRGPAVRASRAQCDRARYRATMKRTIEHVPNLDVRQGQATCLLVEGGRIVGVCDAVGVRYQCRAVVV